MNNFYDDNIKYRTLLSSLSYKDKQLLKEIVSEAIIFGIDQCAGCWEKQIKGKNENRKTG